MVVAAVDLEKSGGGGGGRFRKSSGGVKSRKKLAAAVNLEKIGGGGHSTHSIEYQNCCRTPNSLLLRYLLVFERNILLSHFL